MTSRSGAVGRGETALAGFLRDLMRRKGCNQSQLAKAVGVSHPRVGRWLSGGASPRPATCGKLAEYSGVPLEKVLALAGHFPTVAQTAPSGWPEFREYIERKYPWADETLVDVFEAYLERRRATDQ